MCCIIPLTAGTGEMVQKTRLIKVGLLAPASLATCMRWMQHVQYELEAPVFPASSEEGLRAAAAVLNFGIFETSTFPPQHAHSFSSSARGQLHILVRFFPFQARSRNRFPFSELFLPIVCMFVGHQYSQRPLSLRVFAAILSLSINLVCGE